MILIWTLKKSKSYLESFKKSPSADTRKQSIRLHKSSALEIPVLLLGVKGRSFWSLVGNVCMKVATSTPRERAGQRCMESVSLYSQLGNVLRLTKSSRTEG